jgi:hypothetical protein
MSHDSEQSRGWELSREHRIPEATEATEVMGDSEKDPGRHLKP